METWTLDSANKYVINYFKVNKHKKDEDNKLITALKYLDEKYQSMDAALTLGSIYYDGNISKQDFKLAEEYYLKAEKRGSLQATLNLGYINYYGRVNGKQDYKKAFLCFSKASIECKGNDSNVVSNAIYKLADMYFNGYFVKQDKDYAYKIVKNLLPLENLKSGCEGVSCIGDVLSRLSRYNSSEISSKYDRYLFYKYTTLAIAAIEERNNNFWGDNSVIKKLKISIETYMNENKSSFDYYNHSINKPFKNDIDSFIKMYSHFEGMCSPVNVIVPKNSNDVYIVFLCYNQFISIPEINYANRIETMTIRFNNVTSNIEGEFKFVPEKYRVYKEGNDLVFRLNDAKPLKLTINKNSTFKIVEVSYKPFKGFNSNKPNKTIRSDDYDENEIYGKIIADA